MPFACHPLPRRGGCRLIRGALISLAVAWFTSRSDSAAQAQILRWEIKATVIQIDGPESALPDVRIGDPVRGWLSYHLAAPPDNASNQIYYTHPAAFRVSGMVVENPRTGEELAFVESDGYADVFVYNDSIYPSDEEEVLDYMLTLQGVVPPPGISANLPIVSVELQGPITMFSDATLPQSLNLDDWPSAILAYTDLLGDTAIWAEIYSLESVAVAALPADFDFDNDVDADDLAYWRDYFGSTGSLDGDADLDLDADGADFLAWQRGLGAEAGGGVRLAPAAKTAVPEPAGMAALLLGALLSFRSVRRCRSAVPNR